MTTDSRTYNLHGNADLTVTINVYPKHINVHFTLDVSPADKDEPDHGPHGLLNYLDLPDTYSRPTSYWWCKRNRTVKVRTGSQARRVIERAITTLDDAVSAAVIARSARKAQLTQAFPAQ